MKLYYKYLIIAIMVVVEQGIKLVVRNYQGVSHPIISNFVYFNPTHNTYYSWFNSMLGLQNTRMFHIVLTIILMVLAITIFRFVNSKFGDSISISLLEIFLVAGIICSLIDRVFWNGSLDYIHLKGFFVFDLKDVYLSTFQVLFFLTVVRNWKAFSDLNEKEFIGDLFRFLRGEK